MIMQYSSNDFENKYTYSGSDLGSHWAPDATTFRVWAPTADSVRINLYQSGNADCCDFIKSFPMTASEYGTWYCEIEGNLNGIFYTYTVSQNCYCEEACDPYAHAVGVNGKKAMVVDLNSTNPEGWSTDADPHADNRITDDVIYEVHIRDLTSNAYSGINAKGKFLGLKERGTKTKNGIPTGLDHILSLGVTHIHLLPVFDFGSVDETDQTSHQYNWGYDPVNFNVPEGSYSTNPYDGFTRIREMKQMVKTLHDNHLSVIMDVVYNHVYYTKDFCFNRIVPGYFSRQNGGNLYSNGSGCGNDTASERSMVRKYIVDSVNYWVDEYHIDGFRFDLVGLLDVKTIHEIIESVHSKHPNVVFYGEGWNIATTVTKKEVALATQDNASLLPKFAFFNDTIRDSLRGSVFDSHLKGFVTGESILPNDLFNLFRGRTHWSDHPGQIINYVSCHDNHTLYDRIALALPSADHSEIARRSRLAAAFCLLSTGVPFFQAGEEFLRSKKKCKGVYVSNSYHSPDAINSLKWNKLRYKEEQITFHYYQGLIDLRKRYPEFRSLTNLEASQTISLLDPSFSAFLLSGKEEHLICIFYSGTEPFSFVLPNGTWDILVADNLAGTNVIGKASGEIVLTPLSATVLVQKQQY